MRKVTGYRRPSKSDPFGFRNVSSGRYEVLDRLTGERVGEVRKDPGGRDGGASDAWFATTTDGRTLGIRYGYRGHAARALLQKALASPDGEAARGA